jgi:hypothetical protein
MLLQDTYNTEPHCTCKQGAACAVLPMWRPVVVQGAVQPWTLHAAEQWVHLSAGAPSTCL